MASEAILVQKLESVDMRLYQGSQVLVYASQSVVRNFGKALLIRSTLDWVVFS